MLHIFIILLRLGVTLLGVTDIVSLSSATDSSLDLSSPFLSSLFDSDEDDNELDPCGSLKNFYLLSYGLFSIGSQSSQFYLFIEFYDDINDSTSELSHDSYL
jgi:hypothetical protein